MIIRGAMSTTLSIGSHLPAIPRRILPAIALSQFAGTSLWFAINAVMADLQRESGLPDAAVGWLTAAVQLGFIAGTLGFALWTIADRFSPRLVFLACSLAGAVCAALCAALPPSLGSLIVLRFLTGVFLAGIYPVGMKIAAGWFAQGLGLALGVLVGALVLGTALPFGLRALGATWPWQGVMWAVAAIAAIGGAVMAAVGSGRPAPCCAREILAARLARDRAGPEGARVGVRLLRPHVGAVCVFCPAAAHRFVALGEQRRRRGGCSARLRSAA